MTITQTMKMYLKYKGNNQWEPEIEHIGKSVQMEGEWYLLWVCISLNIHIFSMQNETVSTTTCTYIPKSSKADAKGYKFKRSK
jgi:hypothetical protein